MKGNILLYQNKHREMVNKRHFLNFYFLNKDFLPNIEVNVLNFSTDVKNILMKGTLSQIFYLGLSFCFILKTFGHFLKLNFLDFIKQKLRPK